VASIMKSPTHIGVIHARADRGLRLADFRIALSSKVVSPARRDLRGKLSNLIVFRRAMRAPMPADIFNSEVVPRSVIDRARGP
jgi:hypothetical protein